MPLKRTINGLDLSVVISALQKYIRRGDEVKAMLMAYELLPTYRAYMWKRIKVITLEDIGIANPDAIVQIRALEECFFEFWDEEREGPCRLALANAILTLCRSKKTRISDHFQKAISEKFLCEPAYIDEWTMDGHTSKGRSKGRGLDYFREVSTKLIPEPEITGYEDEAFEGWARDKKSQLGWFK